MPQTLLSLLALVGAAFFTFGQQNGSTHTLKSIVGDEFEVAVAGALLHTTEAADSRAFDQSTTPAALRARLGLPNNPSTEALDALRPSDLIVPVTAFASPSNFGLAPDGSTTSCDPQSQLTSVNCDDISDFNDRGDTWRDVTLTTPNGDPLPVEVHVEVHYVESAAPDVIVNHRTNHKRVDVWARSPLMVKENPGAVVRMHRVISFDPVVALEYLKRNTCVAAPASLVARLAAEARLAAAQASAAAAHLSLTAANTSVTNAERALASAAAAAAAAQATAQQRATQLASANAAAVAATAAQNSAWSAFATAYYEYADAQQRVDDARNNGQRKKAERDRDDAYDRAVAAYATYGTAVQAAQAAADAAQAAQASSTAAWAAATAAQSASDGAAAAAATARATAAQAAAAAETADQAVADAQAAIAALTGCA